MKNYMCYYMDEKAGDTDICKKESIVFYMICIKNIFYHLHSCLSHKNHVMEEILLSYEKENVFVVNKEKYIKLALLR